MAIGISSPETSFADMTEEIDTHPSLTHDLDKHPKVEGHLQKLLLALEVGMPSNVQVAKENVWHAIHELLGPDAYLKADSFGPGIDAALSRAADVSKGRR